MFGLSRREQRWKAEKEAAELLVSLAVAVVQARAEVAKADAAADAKELERLRAENAELRASQLRRE